jgi:hypothetical protein
MIYTKSITTIIILIIAGAIIAYRLYKIYSNGNKKNG